MSRQIHSKEARRLTSKWWGDGRESPTYRLAFEVSGKPDAEVRPLLLARIEADPDSPEAAAARELLPLLVVGDPPHDPADLLDEIDALVRDQEMLRQRALTLAAKYRAIEPWADLWSRDGVQTDEGSEGYVHGDLNINRTVGALSGTAQFIEGAQGYLAEARGHAATVREYDEVVTDA